MTYTGKDLIIWGVKPGKHFPKAIAAANAVADAGGSQVDAILAAKACEPSPKNRIQLRDAGLPYNEFIELAGTGTGEVTNLNAVRKHMAELMRVPTITAGAIMPDACPAGSQAGTIPVGGAVSAVNAIHPGFHSADICCSVAISVLGRDADPKKVLDALQAATHFGPSGREAPVRPPSGFADFSDNPFLNGLEKYALHHFATQGDGNHFAYVGRLRSSGRVAIVTHHGSRGLGAQLYKRGMAEAVRQTEEVAQVPAHNAWIVADTREGALYWDALQRVRLWTRESHYAIHDMAAAAAAASVNDRFWNEHNFVFQKSDGLFYHGKGATPSWSGFSADDIGLTLIPLNCSEPILITRHGDLPGALGFAPHGAGRNFSRSEHLKMYAEKVYGRGDEPDRVHHGILRNELEDLKEAGLDIRAYSGMPDLSELPSAYKRAKDVRGQIEKFKLAEIVDQVEPFGSIMAGEFEKPWLKKKAKAAESAAAE